MNLPAMEHNAREEPDCDARATERPTDGDVIRRRMLAFVADAILLGGVIFAAVRRLTQSRVRRLVVGGASTVILGLLYHIVLEGRFGQTPGKKLFAIAVVRENGEPCTYTAATIRTLLRFVDWLPVGYLVGLASIQLTEHDQRLGDLLAGTIVVRVAQRRGGNRD